MKTRLLCLLLFLLGATSCAKRTNFKPLDYWPGRPVSEFIAERGQPGVVLDQPDGGKVMIWSRTETSSHTLPGYVSTIHYGAGVKNTVAHPGPTVSSSSTDYTTLWVKADGTIERYRVGKN